MSLSVAKIKTRSMRQKIKRVEKRTWQQQQLITIIYNDGGGGAVRTATSCSESHAEQPFFPASLATAGVASEESRLITANLAASSGTIDFFPALSVTPT